MTISVEVDSTKKIYVCRYINKKQLNKPVFCVCKIRATADRIAKAENNRTNSAKHHFQFVGVSEEFAHCIEGTWFFPSNLISPSPEDIRVQEAADKKDRERKHALLAKQKALKLGLTEEDIRILGKL